MPPPDLLRRVRRHALRSLYLAEAEGEVRVGAPHPYWHSPFMRAAPDATPAAREARALAAGEIWLCNFDLDEGAELLLQDDRAGWWLLFRRRRAVGEHDVISGPHAGSVLTGGGALPEPGFSCAVLPTPTPYEAFDPSDRVRREP